MSHEVGHGRMPTVERTSLTSASGLLAPLLEAATGRGARVRFAVDGASMLPLIRSGDIVEARPLADLPARAGDVVAVLGTVSSSLLLHRVVRRADRGLLVRGDNSPRADGWYGPETVLAVVVAVERRQNSAWFGSGRLGCVVAFAVRHGLIWRVNRVYYGVRRRLVACLKFLRADSRLREHKGDDGNE